MECEVAAEVRMENRIMVLSAVCRVDGLHTCIKAKGEEVE